MALVPDVVRRLRAAEHEVDRRVRRGPAGRRDGRAVSRPRGRSSAIPWSAEVVAKVAPPSEAELAKLRPGHDPGRLPQPARRPRRAGGDRRDRRDGAGDGADPAHQPRAVDGRALEPGHGLRLPRGADRLDRARALLPDVHDRGGHGPARAGARAGRGRGGAAGDRDRAPARRGGHRVRHPQRREGADPVARRALLRGRGPGRRGGRGRLRARADAGGAADPARRAVRADGQVRRDRHDRAGARAARRRS